MCVISRLYGMIITKRVSNQLSIHDLIVLILTLTLVLPLNSAGHFSDIDICKAKNLQKLNFEDSHEISNTFLFI